MVLDEAAVVCNYVVLGDIFVYAMYWQRHHITSDWKADANG